MFQPGPRSPLCPIMLTTSSLFALGSRLRTTASSVSGQFWPSANRAIYVPFELPSPSVVLKGFMINAGSTAGNYDWGVFDMETGTKLVSSGATAQSGGNVIQEFNVTDTYLPVGRYYLALSSSSTGGGVWMWNVGDGQLVKSLGVAQEASAEPLPSTMTPAAAASQLVPEIGIALRTLAA